ncbi:MAG: hypothetical protein U1E91_05715 [Moraxella sp.]
MQQSQTEYNRLKSLLAMNAISKQELEQADTAVKTAQANVDSAKRSDCDCPSKYCLIASRYCSESAQQTIKKSQTDVNTAEKILDIAKLLPRCQAR